jgi:hypothetical protein
VAASYTDLRDLRFAFEVAVGVGKDCKIAIASERILDAADDGGKTGLAMSGTTAPIERVRLIRNDDAAAFGR